MHKTENIYVDAYMLQIGAYMLLTVFIYAAKVTYMYLAVLHICTHTGIYALPAVIYATRIIVKGAYMHKTENIYVDAYML